MSDAQKWLLLAITVTTGWLVYLLAPVLTPFLVAALLAYLGDPVVDRLEERGFSRTVGVTAVFLVLLLAFFLLVLLLIPLLDNQIRALIQQLPTWIQWGKERLLPFLQNTLGLEVGLPALDALREALRAHWQQAGGLAAGIVASVSTSGLALAGWMANLALIPVLAFYFLRDWDRLMEGIRGLLPRAYEPNITTMVGEADEVLAGFLRGQLLVMLTLGTFYAIGLWLAGLKLGLLIGMLAGLVTFVPYLGPIMGIITASVAMLMQTGVVWDLIPVALVFGTGQLLEGFVLTPLLVGDRVGLHPVAVIFAVMAGGTLFGFIGVLLGLPVAAVLAVFVRHAHQRYLASDLYQQTGTADD